MQTRLTPTTALIAASLDFYPVPPSAIGGELFNKCLTTEFVADWDNEPVWAWALHYKALNPDDTRSIIELAQAEFPPLAARMTGEELCRLTCAEADDKWAAILRGQERKARDPHYYLLEEVCDRDGDWDCPEGDIYLVVVEGKNPWEASRSYCEAHEIDPMSVRICMEVSA